MPANSENICIEDVLNNNESEKKRKFPYEIVKVDPELNTQLLKDFTGDFQNLLLFDY